MNLGNRLLRVARTSVTSTVKEAAETVKETIERGLNHPRVDDARIELESFLRDSQSRRTAAEPAARPSAPPPPPPSKPHPYAAEYRLLGAAVGSDFDAVRSAWRAKVRENHPDQFARDPAAQQAASDRLRTINDAYHRLKTHLGA
jgi:DnaJ-domain-containing protein 1